MSPLIPNGVYKIRNLQFKYYVADLTDGTKGGPINGFRDLPWNRFDRWTITNVGEAGNQITIENRDVHEVYAYANEQIGAKLYASPYQMIWTVVKLDRGYYLQSPSGEYVWELPQGADGVGIFLNYFTGEDNTKWTFERLYK